MSEHDPRGHAPEPAGGIDEEIDVRGILKVGLWIVGITVGSFVVMYIAYIGLVRTQSSHDPQPSPIAAAPAQVLPPAPRLQGTQMIGQRQVLPEDELRMMRAGEEQRLHSWGWVDRTAGVAHVPIEHALDMELARHAQTAAPAKPVGN